MSFPAFAQAVRLSLCMIVRNEAKHLAEALASAKPWVGEMVVVDTGSTDATVAIAEAAGARVLHHHWKDDFSEARNVALEAAKSPWVLVMDADERLEVHEPNAMAEALQQQECQGFNLRMRNRLDDGSESHAVVFRLFRRDLKGMHYRGVLHEQVVAVAEGKVRTALLEGVGLLHLGYLNEQVDGHRKRERNLRLAQKLVQEQGHDPYAHHALGLAHEQAMNWKDAALAHAKALSLLGPKAHWGAFEQSLHGHAVRAWRANQKPEEAMKVADQGLVHFPFAPDLRLHRGQLRLDAQAWAGAEEDFRAAISPQAKASLVVEDPASVAWEARTALGLALAAQGRALEAEGHWEAAVKEAPAHFVKAHRLLGSLRLEQGKWAQAAALLGQAFLHEPEAVRFHLAWAQHKLGQHEAAAELLQAIAQEPQAMLLLGKVRLAQGKATQALPLLVACPLPAATLPRAWAFHLSGQEAAARTAWNEWLRAAAGDWGIKDALALALALLAGDAPQGPAPEAPAEAVAELGHWLRLLLRHERFQDVEAFISGAARLPEAWWRPLRREWGIALTQEGFAEMALELLLPAREADPEDGEIYAWLGMAALERGLPDVAGDMWCTALELIPDHAVALEGLRLLGAQADPASEV